MQASVTKILKNRIRSLEMQGYATLVLIAVIVAYGFFISSRSGETTAADINDIRRNAEKAVVEAGIISNKIDLLDKMTKLDNLVSKMREELNSVVYSMNLNINGRIITRDDSNLSFRPDTALFTTKFYFAASNSLINFDVPAPCLGLFLIPINRPLSEFFLAGDMYSSLSLRNDIARRGQLYVPGDVGKEITEKYKEAIATQESAKAEVLCSSANSSVEFKSVLDDMQRIDLLLDRQSHFAKDKLVSASKADPIPSHSIPESNLLLLLLLNKFGPLIIFFFFSSMLIALYKYSARLVSFYYGRLMGVEALGGMVEAKNFNEVASTFTPSAINFGKTPPTPLELVQDIAAKASEKLDAGRIVK